MSAPFYIGIDAGGSKTELLAQAGESAANRIGPGVNLQREGAEQSAETLATLITETLATLEHDGTGSICAGIAGAGRPAEQDDLAARLRDRIGASLPSISLTIEHDALIALDAAFELESGMIVVIGTGSAVLARTEEDTMLRAGGWGPRIGDEGSGTAIGTAALGAVAADFDGGESTVLRHHLTEQYGLETPDDIIRKVYAEGWKVQELAPLVVAAAEAGDWACTRVLKVQANALAQRAGWLVARAPEPITPRIALLGGLSGEAYYRACVSEALLRYLPRWRIVRPSRRPVQGALARAQRNALASKS